MIKNMLLIGVGALLSSVTSAQDTNKAAPTVDPKVLKAAATTNHAGEWMVVKKGKVYSISNGKTQLIQKDIQLDNGSTLRTNGEVVMKDGSKVQIKEDEKINMLGDLAKVADTTIEKIPKAPPPPAPVTK